MHSYQKHLQAVKAKLPLLTLLSAVVAAVVFVSLQEIGPSHSTHYSYLISLAEQEPAAEYRFDGYYALQATDLFAATLTAWITTPEILVEAYQRARVPIESPDFRALVRSVEARKTAPQLITVTVKNARPEIAESVALGLQEIVAEKVALYHDEGLPALQFNVVATEPVTSRQVVTSLPVALGVFALFLVVSINLVIINSALKENL